MIHMWQSGIINYILYLEHMTVFESLYGGVPSKDGADKCFKTESFRRHITKCVWTPTLMDAQHYSMLNSVMYLKYVIQFLFLSGIVTHSYAPKRIYIGNQGPWSCSILSAKIKRLNSGEFLDPISCLAEVSRVLCNEVQEINACSWMQNRLWQTAKLYCNLCLLALLCDGAYSW